MSTFVDIDMARWIDRFLLSSLGKKFIMASTGFLLVGFLVMHLVGNTTLLADRSGDQFVAYASGMHDLGPILWVGELGLLALFACHIWVAVRLTNENRTARPVGYAYQASLGKRTVASRSMFVTGSIVLGFLVIHLVNFRFARGLGAPESRDLHGLVVDVLTTPLWAFIYIIGSLAVGLHVSHGFRSAFQSLGASHPRLELVCRRLGYALAIVFAVGFASFPIMALVVWKGAGS